MTLDYPSILFVIVVINVFNITLFAYEYFFHHKKWYLFTFIVGILFQTIAMILIGYRSVLPFLYTVQISNFFFISSFAIIIFSILSFDGVLRKKMLWLFTISALLFYFSFLLTAEDHIIRIIIQIIACAYFYGIGAYSLLTNKKHYAFSNIIGVALLLYSVFQIVRAFVLYNIDQPYNFLDGSKIDNWYLIISLFIVSTLRIGFIMFLKEIAEDIIAKNNIRIEKDKLKLEELNETKNKLLSIIAHDLRSPFNSILGFSLLLKENSKDFTEEERDQYLEVIHSSAQSTLVLLNNLLHWARSQTGQLKLSPKKILLSSIFKEIIQLSNSSAVAKQISLVQQNEDDIEVYTDIDMLKLVLRNLISNAIKFTNPEGKICVSAKRIKDQVEISVSDNGVGMSQDAIDNLFNLSTSETTMGTANEKGSGLGLILCKELIEKQGGKIWVESQLGHGSSFKFTLP